LPKERGDGKRMKAPTKERRSQSIRSPKHGSHRGGSTEKGTRLHDRNPTTKGKREGDKLREDVGSSQHV